MQAIRTKYIGPSTHKGARIAVYNNDIRCYYSYNLLESDLLNNEKRLTEQNIHMFAAIWFCQANGWAGTLNGGMIKGAEAVFFFSDDLITEEI